MAMLSTPCGIDPRAWAHLALLVVIVVGGAFGRTLPARGRAGVCCIGVCLACVAGEGLIAPIVRNAPSLINQLRSDLPAFLGALALVAWGCKSRRKLDGWQSLGGILLAYGLMCVAAWVAGVKINRARDMLAMFGEPRLLPFAAAYFAPGALGALYAIAGHNLMRRPHARALLFRTVAFFALWLPVLLAWQVSFVGRISLAYRVAVFLGMLQPAVVTAALLAFCEYHGWRFAGREGACLECGYDLTGNVSGRCPECGCAMESLAKEDREVGP
jgi:hypothetical protein